MWSRDQIHDHACDAFAKAVISGCETNVARAAMIDTAIAMAIDNASFVAQQVGAHVAEDEILALKERCTLAVRPRWYRRLFNWWGA